MTKRKTTYTWTSFLREYPLKGNLSIETIMKNRAHTVTSQYGTDHGIKDGRFDQVLCTLTIAFNTKI